MIAVDGGVWAPGTPLDEVIERAVELADGPDFVVVHVRRPSLFGRREQAAERAPHPAPEVPARLAQEHEVPKAARPVRAAAEAAGWTVVATYARGTKVTKDGAGPVVDSLALRMRRGQRRAVAVWVGGRFSFGMRWGADVPVEELGVKALTAWLS